MQGFLITRKQAAQILGVSPDVLWRYTRQGIVPQEAVIRAGRRLWYRRTVLEEWARGSRRQATPQEEAT